MRTPEDTRERDMSYGAFSAYFHITGRCRPMPSEAGRRGQWGPFVNGPALLTHQRQCVVLTVQKLGQPQVVIRHAGDDMGLSNKTDAPRSKDAVRPLDVVHRIVND